MSVKVSIIIPTYNRANLIAETLDSIAAQDYQDWECVIVDDGSADDTNLVVSTYTSRDARFRYFTRPEHLPRGGNASRNFGFAQSRGEFVNWFDSDDLMRSDFISAKVAALTANASLDGVISKRVIFEGRVDNLVSYESRTAVTKDILSDFLVKRVTWFLQDVMWRREFLEARTLFDEELLFGQDREFHVRMLIDNPSLQVVDKYLTYYRIHAASITKDMAKVARPELRQSHLKASLALMQRLKTAGKLTNEIRLQYFDQFMVYLPVVVNSPVHRKMLWKLLGLLSFPSFRIAYLWLRFTMAFVSFRLFGKGYHILKYR